MIEKGSRKTAPPDTASVKVHRYNLKIRSNTFREIKTQVNTKRNKRQNIFFVFEYDTATVVCMLIRIIQ